MIVRTAEVLKGCSCCGFAFWWHLLLYKNGEPGLRFRWSFWILRRCSRRSKGCFSTLSLFCFVSYSHSSPVTLQDTHSESCSSCYRTWPSKCGLNQSKLVLFPKNLFPLSQILSFVVFFFFLIQGRTWTFGLVSKPAPKPRHQIYVAVSNQQMSVQSYTKLMLLKLTGFYYDQSLLCQLLPIPWPWLPSALWLKCLNFCPGMCACESAGRWGIAYLSLTHPLIISNWHVFICPFILKYWVSAWPEFHCWRYSGQVRQIRSLIWWCLYSRERKAHNKHVNKWDNSR